MSDIVQAFDPSSTTGTQFVVPQSAVNGALVFWNESNISLNLSFQDGTLMYLPAWYHKHKCGYSGNVNVDWSVRTVLNSQNPPLSEVIVEAYDHGEHFPADGPLVRQANGSTASSVTSTNAIVNTGNPPLTAIITVQPNDAVGNTIQLDSSGNLIIKSDNAGALTNLLQLVAGAGPEVIIAAASIITQILGALTVGGNATVTGNVDATGTVRAETGSFYGTDASNTILQSTGTSGTGNTRLQNTDHISIQVPGGTEAIGVSSSQVTIEKSLIYTGQLGVSTAGDVIDASSGADTYLKCRSGGNINFQSPNGNTVAHFDTSGFLNLVHSVNLPVGSLGQLSKFSGTGNGTVATGVTNPTTIAFDPCTASGSSQTIGGTIASSSVVTTGAGLAWSATAWHA